MAKDEMPAQTAFATELRRTATGMTARRQRQRLRHPLPTRPEDRRLAITAADAPAAGRGAQPRPAPRMRPARCVGGRFGRRQPQDRFPAGAGRPHCAKPQPAAMPRHCSRLARYANRAASSKTWRRQQMVRSSRTQLRTGGYRIGNFYEGHRRHAISKSRPGTSLPRSRAPAPCTISPCSSPWRRMV